MDKLLLFISSSRCAHKTHSSPVINQTSNRASSVMDYLNFFILLFATISTVISYEMIQNCDYEIDEGSLPVTSDVLTGSPLILKQLAENEEIIHAFVQRDYFNSPDLTYCQRHLMQQYLVHFESSTGKLSHRYKLSGQQVSSRAHNVAWNPIATFLMMRRFRSFLLPLVASLNVTSQQGIFATITNMMSITGWPSVTSLNASIDAVLRIQHVHDLPTTDVAKGKLDNESTGLSISSEDSAIIAERALTEGKLALAIEWFEQALTGSSDHQEQRKDYVRSLQDAINTHDSRWETAFSTMEELQYVFTTKVTDVPREMRVRRRTQLLDEWEKAQNNEAFLEMYWGLCSGNNYQSQEERSRLFCYYESSRHPSLTIGPIRTEVLTSDRMVVLQFYDVLDDVAIKKLQQEVSTGLQISKLSSGAPIDLNVRSSLGVFIKDNLRDDIKVGRIVEILTGLKVRGSETSSEDMQVAAYSTGSHYLMHYDMLAKNENMTTDTIQPIRLATFLLYLSDVVKGGGTSFVQGRVAASPVKGSAVLWFNVVKSSERDDSSMHGACPVVIGEKWIANKWILYHDQAFQAGYQCELDFEAKFKLNDLVNNAG